MRIANCLIAALCVAGLAGFVRAETVAVGDRIEVQKPEGPAPTRGMSMQEVSRRFGEPAEKLPAVGKPPITRWKYRGYTVYFEYRTVIDTVTNR
ncbi:MAG: hypothetical protein KGL34_13605 [Gammaproteobacteria bacterium]|nr:hypothetical protein [Gammaproteobacteria bacterium]